MEAEQKAKHQPGGVAARRGGAGEGDVGQTTEMDDRREAPSDRSGLVAMLSATP